MLHAVTRPLDRVPTLAELLGYADPQDPLVWVRGDRGCVGVGEAGRMRFTGADRFARAAATWREIAAGAAIDDPVGLPGTGLLAFGAFAFSDADTAESVLVVPRLLIARHRGTAWITEVSEGPLGREPRLPDPSAPGRWTGAALRVGARDEAYLSGVREATARIERRAPDADRAEPTGRVEKIVLARQVEGRIRGDDDLRVPLTRLAERYEDCWTYAVDGLVGASPETLVRRTDGAISARVLAGTRGRKPADPAADAGARDELLTSSKEQHEHAFAVQSVITALSPHVRELHTSEEPFALRLPNVWHLATELGAVPGDGGSSLELAAALHPTAAVAGTPTAAAVAAIAELEPAPRGRYAGPVGWIDADGEGEWVIALRCAQLDPASTGVADATAARTGDAADGGAADRGMADADAGRRITAYAGGGIVQGSDPEHEFGETVSKFAPIADAFAP